MTGEVSGRVSGRNESEIGGGRVSEVQSAPEPATPLPWTATDYFVDAVTDDRGAQTVATVGEAGPPPFRDAVYIAHAANSYPRLVGVISDLLGYLDRTFDDSHPWKDISVGFDAARYLLADLGEQGAPALPADRPTEEER